MRALGMSPWSMTAAVGVCVALTLTLIWAGAAFAGAPLAAGLPWNLLLGGFILGFGAALLVVRPIIIPWTLLRARRVAHQLFARPTRYEPPMAVASQAAPQPTPLERMMLDADAVAQRALEVQEILDAARANQPRRELELRA